MTISFVMQRIYDMAQGQIAGISTVYQTIPQVVQDSELPCLIPWPGPNVNSYQDDIMGEDQFESVRRYDLIVLYSRPNVATPGETQIGIEALIDTVITFFIARPGLTLVGQAAPQTMVLNTKVTGDQGIETIEYAKQPYLGFRLALEVQEIVDIAYVD